VVKGSQALHGKYPDVADQILTSFEVDLIASKRVERAEWLNVIGVDSQFHEMYGCARLLELQPSLGARQARRLDAVCGAEFAHRLGQVIAHRTLG